jgi:hypothetical protein
VPLVFHGEDAAAMAVESPISRAKGHERRKILTFLLKTSSFMPFFNCHASVIMSASKTNRRIRLPRQMTGPSKLKMNRSARALTEEKAPARAHQGSGVAGGTCRCTSGNCNSN